MIEIFNLSKIYKKTEVLSIPEIVIKDCEVVCLIGHNGSGKTTLLKILLDLIEPTTGTVSINQVNIHNSESWKLNVNAYLDDQSLINFLSPEEFFDITASLRNVTKQELTNHLLNLEQFFCGEVLNKDKKISDFSRGNRQKIGIVASLIGTPKYLFLDEPLSNLDTQSIQFIKNHLIDLNIKHKTTIVLSTHDGNFMNSLSCRYITLKSGRIISDS